MQEKIKSLLQEVKQGRTSVKNALKKIQTLPYIDMEFCKFDTHRNLRRGYPEVIFCPGKKIEHIVEIVSRIKDTENNIVLTRADEKIFHKIKEVEKNVLFFEEAKIILVKRKQIKVKNSKKYILVMAAGTADISVSEEAAVISEIFGNKVERLYDVGVAGIHRLFDNLDRIIKAAVIIVVAGMEGALPSVVSGLVSSAVIAVPTSVGYGANFQGLAPLLTMLNSCSPGIAVVNIDNGFGAGYLASLINRRI